MKKTTHKYINPIKVCFISKTRKAEYNALFLPLEISKKGEELATKRSTIKKENWEINSQRKNTKMTLIQNP